MIKRKRQMATKLPSTYYRLLEDTLCKENSKSVEFLSCISTEILSEKLVKFTQIQEN